MAANSALYKQAVDLAYAIQTAASNGQITAQNIKVYLEALAGAVMLLGTSVNNLIVQNGTLTVTGQTPTAGSQANGQFTAATTALPTNYVGTDVAIDGTTSINTGLIPIAVQQP